MRPSFCHATIIQMNLQAAREQMVEQQVRAWDVLDERVLQTMLQVLREEFAPLRYRDVAFADAAIPLAQMSRPPRCDSKAAFSCHAPVSGVMRSW